jgi:hypothetical protein
MDAFNLFGDLNAPATKPELPPPPSTVDPIAFARTRLNFHPDSNQARVLDPTITRGLLNCCRQWGKSTTTAVKAVHHAFSRPESLTIVLSPSARQSAEFIQKVSTFLLKLDIKPRGDGHNDISLLLPNRARIVGLPGSEHTIRGFSNVSLLLIDEASRVPDELYAAVRPMMATATGAQLWLLSTPYGCEGFYYEAWVEEDETSPNPWTRIIVPATACPRISPKFLEDERRSLGETIFRQEYLCEFTSSDDALFSPGDVHFVVDPEVELLFPLGHPLWG